MWAGGVRGARHCLSGPRMVFSPGFCAISVHFKTNLEAEMFVRRDEFAYLDLCMQTGHAPGDITLKSEHNCNLQKM